MPFLRPHIILSLLAGFVAIAGLNLAFPVEVARSVTGGPFAALLASLPGTAGATRGLPVLTVCSIAWTIARHVVLGVARRGVAAACAFGDRVTAGRARVAVACHAAIVVLSLSSAFRLLKWTADAS
jgi:hypothetical protein